MAVLHITVGSKLGSNQIFSAGINIGIVFLRLVAVIISIGIEITNVILYPKHFTEMVARITIGSTTKRSAQLLIGIV